ncbi:hypothetical protein DRF59_11190 [Chryseobacterium flavum]|uniref:Alpha/beta hydrolase n=1 Tax=Chryseobacterium flavum TaxID=415851 RepID=A0A3D9CM91_9FLAO|nr:hypothetical protein [Chryseobacterium flavum]REC66865.1 hypothetical protein DRF59_11190 [Chryseobacterium flavum]
MQILFIHGRAQENFAQEELLEKWSRALKQSFENAGITYPEELTLTLPYYGKELILQRDLYQQDLEDKIYQMRSPDGSPEERDPDDLQKFQGQLLDEIRKEVGITDKQIHEEEKEEIQDRGLRNWWPVLAIARLLDNYSKANGLANSMILKETLDVATYLVVPKAKKTINKFFIDALTKEPTIVIAHSLGTVIAYDILQKLKREEWDICGLITLGSPLGVNAVTRQFREPPKYPSVIKEIWLNLYDKHDIVSLRPLEGGHFRVDPKIINYEVINETEDRHGIEGYLSSPFVATAVSELLNSR